MCIVLKEKKREWKSVTLSTVVAHAAHDVVWWWEILWCLSCWRLPRGCCFVYWQFPLSCIECCACTPRACVCILVRSQRHILVCTCDNRPNLITCILPGGSRAGARPRAGPRGWPRCDHISAADKTSRLSWEFKNSWMTRLRFHLAAWVDTSIAGGASYQKLAVHPQWIQVKMR